MKNVDSKLLLGLVVGAAVGAAVGYLAATAVSYTHLTLPTIA